MKIILTSLVRFTFGFEPPCVFALDWSHFFQSFRNSLVFQWTLVVGFWWVIFQKTPLKCFTLYKWLYYCIIFIFAPITAPVLIGILKGPGLCFHISVLGCLSALWMNEWMKLLKIVFAVTEEPLEELCIDNYCNSSCFHCSNRAFIAPDALLPKMECGTVRIA